MFSYSFLLANNNLIWLLPVRKLASVALGTDYCHVAADWPGLLTPGLSHVGLHVVSAVGYSPLVITIPARTLWRACEVEQQLSVSSLYFSLTRWKIDSAKHCRRGNGTGLVRPWRAEWPKSMQALIKVMLFSSLAFLHVSSLSLPLIFFCFSFYCRLLLIFLPDSLQVEHSKKYLSLVC